jgi:clan AA aspartic protease
MGKVTEEITLANAGDKRLVGTGALKAVRQVTVNAIVDTGASTLIINEETRRQLGLVIEGTRRTTFANGAQEECGRTEPVNIRWKDRDCNCSAVVVPGVQSILLGAIPLEDMDLLVDPVKQQLVGAHGDVVEALAL